ncbi:short-chain dehydrogenase reductase family [Colletotrichum truncatum]|uniref:Short-chain dehydrogenase reductase family n=1 Tax=Colletotrichum truncatum TaxID=5467 RepID=A0ACC3ZGW2_COLTU|nr:short-chain dehydrogenase reductase family [Colletotrichum truncatum]KAF6784655.1 short-chain dehydrogenase reductase family [Colletotrichum truncatum]
MAPQLGWETKGSDLAKEYADQIKGKTILVTGVSPGGLGASFAETIAAGSPRTLILAGRNPTKVQQTADAISGAHSSVTTKTLELDLGSFKNVRKAAETVNGWDDVPHIDVLVNNAGIMAVPFKLTEDGFESQFGTNHLGPFLFTNLIINKVLAAPEPRIVTISSDGHRLGHIRWTDYNFNDGKHYNQWHAYGQSKTANCLMALALAEKLGRKGLLSFSAHPGVIMTNLSNHLEDFDSLSKLKSSLGEQDIRMGTKFMWSDFKFKTPDQGVATHIYAAFSPDLKATDVNGKYFQDCHVADQYNEEVYPWATDKTDADRLWKLSEKLVGEEFKFE